MYRLAAIVLALTLPSLAACSSQSSQSSSAATDAPTEPSSNTVSAAPDLSQQTRDTPGPPATPEPIPADVKRKATTFLARADQIYSSAQAIVAQPFPTTQTEVSYRVAPGTAYNDFQRADRKFQDDEPHVNLARGPATINAMYLNLAEFETFVWDAVTAVSSCNRMHSRLNMMVANAFLKEAHRNLAGVDDPSWNPPDITNMDSDMNECGG